MASTQEMDLKYEYNANSARRIASFWHLLAWQAGRCCSPAARMGSASPSSRLSASATSTRLSTSSAGTFGRSMACGLVAGGS